ncbi:MAG: hypothetical protein P8046_00325 [Anaerolineales bacterium]
MTKKTLGILIATILVLTMATTVFAAEGDPEACTGTEVSGTVVAYDADLNVVTIDTGDGNSCTVALTEGEQDYGHPITTLLGNYFNNLSSESSNFEDALASKEVCLDLVDGEYVLFDPGEGECPYPGTLTQENEDGTFHIVLEGGDLDGFDLTVEDEEAAAGLTGILAGLEVNLNEDGSLEDAGDMIGALHDDGVGFGVIVKLYGIADANGEVSLEALIAEYQGGASIGELFAKYGKPALLGVGHVRKNANNTTDEAAPVEGETVEGAVEGDLATNTTKDNKGICNARANGGKAKANGHGEVDCGDGD